MKKGIVVVLVLLAAIVLISPAIVGRLAERAVDENLNWAATESGEMTVTTEYFDRGWFSSEGQHRVQLSDGQLKSVVESISGGPGSDVPVLLINTRIDHGLIPVSSMSREQGSLVPGLGDAVSTLQVELPDGEVIDLPGTIYSKATLGGELVSNYLLEAGTAEIEGAEAGWGNADIKVTTNPSSGVVSFDGDIDSVSAFGGQDGVGISGLHVEGEQRPTKYGFAIGDMSMTLDEASFGGGMGGTVRMSEFSASGNSTLDGDKTGGDANVSMKVETPQIPGELGVKMVFNFDGLDAASLGSLNQKLKKMSSASGATPDFSTLEADFKTLMAKGFTMNVPTYDVTMPQGTVSTTMSFEFAEEDPDTFEWTSLLLSTTAAIDISIPADLVDMVATGNPQAAMVIGGGYLVKRGDVYIMEARMEKGLLTINGAPIPIPVGAF